MPKHAIGSDGDFRYEICARDRDAFLAAKPRSATRRITRSCSLTCFLSRNFRNSVASVSVVTVAAMRTRNPSARIRSMPCHALTHVPFPRCRSWRSGVGLSRLICNVTRSRGNDRSASRRRPTRSIPFVGTVVGAAAAHAVKAARCHQVRKARLRLQRSP